MGHSFFVHIVTFNSERWIRRCLEGVLAQKRYSYGENLFVHVTDNASDDTTLEILNHGFAGRCTIQRNRENLGFCGGHNQGAARFLASDADLFLVLNPDVWLREDALLQFSEGLERFSGVEAACGKLYRSDQQLQPLGEAVLDSTGMVMERTLRHFDRGSGELDTGQYDEPEFVFGGTGACVVFTRRFVKEAVLDGGPYESDVDRLYPQLHQGRGERALLFDEAFFAYREDADLAWRAGLLGFRCVYLPGAVGYHVRVVTPSRRKLLPPLLNLLGVRNRFLLQLNNIRLSQDRGAILPGLVGRNIVVLLGVLLWERSSFQGLLQLRVLWRRALARRRRLFARIGNGSRALAGL